MALYAARVERAKQFAAARERARLAAEAAFAQRMEEQADSDELRLALADTMRDRGEIRLATKAYLNLVHSRHKNEPTVSAKERVDDLGREGLELIAAIDTTLSGIDAESYTGTKRRVDLRAETPAAEKSPAKISTPENAKVDEELIRQFEESRRAFLGDDNVVEPAVENLVKNPPPVDETLDPDVSLADAKTPEEARAATIQKAFYDYDQVARNYHYLPRIGDQIELHITKRRQRPEFVTVLDEPESANLFELAQQQEADEQICCAYLTYQKAARALLQLAETKDDHKHPPVEDLDAWLKQVGTGGDADAGWRVFFGAGSVRCASCHRFQGRGTHTGPDLTAIAARTSRRDVLQSILLPSREMAPQFVPSIITTKEGRVHQGLWQGYDDNGDRESFLAADGSIFQLDPAQIESRQMAKISIMPEGLQKQLSIEDIRNLLALLSDEKSGQ